MKVLKSNIWIYMYKDNSKWYPLARNTRELARLHRKFDIELGLPVTKIEKKVIKVKV